MVNDRIDCTIALPLFLRILHPPARPSKQRGRRAAPRLQVSANFSLQTKGTEVPREKLSRHSPVVTLQTNFGGQGPLGYERCLGKGRGAPTSVKARLASAKALDDSISTSAGVGLRSSLSEVHRLHGQYMATGKGGLYI